MTEEKTCPECGSKCWCDEVDIGVGTLYGPWQCDRCGWHEPWRVDEAEEQKEEP